MLDDDLELALNPRLRVLRRAERVKGATKINLPRLRFWNYSACAAHTDVGPQVDCMYRKCGGDFFDHQTVAITWSYLVSKGIIASVTGAGKTNQVFGLAALMKERGELTGRAVVICQTPAVQQWLEEAYRFIPKIRVAAVTGGMTKKLRVASYVSNWEILIIGHHVLLKDIEMLMKLEPKMVVTDDVDPILNHRNATHRAVCRLAERADRVLVINATNLQTHLQQLHAAAVPVGGNNTWGSLRAFERRYVRQEAVTIWNSKSKRKATRFETVGYKNIGEFKEKLAPMVLRHTYDDLTDIRMPEIAPPENIWLELHPAQRAKYDELQAGVLRLMKAHARGETIKHTTALTMVGYGQRICAGLPALGEADGSQASVKLDWLMRQLTHDWSDTKIVVFIKNVGLVEAFQTRLDNAGIGHATVSGAHRKARQEHIDRFWNDPNCRVLMGTSAVERSLNLQVSNVIVFVDTYLNPSSVFQIVGRVRRAGSHHKHVFVFNLLATNTQEEKYQHVQAARQGLIDHVWEESSELFEKLSPMQLLQMLGPRA